MGSADRKAKEKDDLKALILEGARKLFHEQGIEKTTIRNIADSIDYSIGTVYVYFKDKNDILHSLHSQGFGQLGGEMRVLFNVLEPMERLKALGRVYINFALHNPDMYDLMFSQKAPMDFLEEINNDEWNEGRATFDVLKTTVNDCISSGYFHGHQLEPLSFLIWSVVHGMCSLYISHRVKGVSLESTDAILDEAYTELVKMIENK